MQRYAVWFGGSMLASTVSLPEIGGKILVLTLYILLTRKRVLWETVKTKMERSMVQHFFRANAVH